MKTTKTKITHKITAICSMAFSMALMTTALSPTVSQSAVVRDIDQKLESLLGHKAQIRSIFEADAKRLNQGTQKNQPWSGSFWPDIRGNIANHYRQYKHAGKVNYVMNYGRVSPRFYRDFKDVVENYQSYKNDEFNEMLSPSEKYDLLIGNKNFEFTRAIISELEFRQVNRLSLKFKNGTEVSDDDDGGESGGSDGFYEDSADPFELKVDYRYWQKKGKNLVLWSGICDGWGPAAVYLPRPAKPVTLMGASGRLITFYPDDLKALGSYLFARTNTSYFATMNYQVAGKRCFDKGKPSRNSDGSVEEAGCNDLDAGLFHSVLVNRVGMDRLGFVADVDNNNKINNHPVAGYQSTYFNLQTGKEGSLRESVMPRDQIKDGYASRRNSNTKYLVGVKTSVTYMNYTWPEELSDTKYDSPSQDKFKIIDYTYDLELDAQGNILGGEWGNRAKENGRRVGYAKQPDFIWMSTPTALPYSEQSVYTFSGSYKDPSNPRPFGNMQWAWNGTGPMPEDWLAAAKIDQEFIAPQLGKKCYQDYHADTKTWSSSCEQGAVLKSAQPLSNLVYFLFDHARSSADK